MSDPLSIISGVAGCLSLGISVIQSLVDYYSSLRGQDARIDGIFRNLEYLLISFQRLKETLHERQFSSEEIPMLKKIAMSIESCEEIIHELHDEARKITNSSKEGFRDSLKMVGRRVSYPFRESSLKKLEEDAREIRDNIMLALDVLNLTDSSRVRSDVDELKSLLSLVRSSQLRKDLTEWLKAPDATANHNEAYSRRNPGSGLWLLNHRDFSSWLDTDNSFIWLYGFAGCGKSILCSTLIQHTFKHSRSQINTGIAFFYFTFNDESKQSLSNMLKAFLIQLSSQLTDGNSFLDVLKRSCHDGDPSIPALTSALQEMIRKFAKTFLIIDALDEIPLPRSRESVLQALKDLLGMSGSNVHIAITSRDLPDIREQIQQTGTNISMKNNGVDSDISDFISTQLERSVSLRRWSSYHSRIRESLQSRAQGVFRWVVCQLDSIARCPRSKAALEKRLASLPESLDETYERMLMNIESDHVEDARRIFTMLCYAHRPMTIAEVIDGLTVRLGSEPHMDLDFRLEDENDILYICPGFVDISYDSEDPRLRIAHFSVQEYLESDRIQQHNASKYKMDKSVAHEELSITCLTYLLDPIFSQPELEQSIFTERPFAEFAATYWHRHYSKVQNLGSTTKSLIDRLFRDKSENFVNWIKLHDPSSAPFSSPFFLYEKRETIPAPIFYASLLGLSFLVPDLLLEERAERVVKIYGTPLQAAASRGHEEVVRLLLGMGEDVDAAGGDYSGALHAATSGGHKSLVQLLLDNGANINASGRHGSALQAASRRGYKELAQLLLDHGADVNTIDDYGGTALQEASSIGYVDIVQLLLDRGADIHTQGANHGTALRAAVSGGHQSVVQLLLDKGADINCPDEERYTLLQEAVFRGSHSLAEFLIDNGADINATHGRGSALQAASDRGNQGMVRLLLSKGANVNVRKPKAGSAIQSASWKGHFEVVSILLSHGADPNIWVSGDGCEHDDDDCEDDDNDCEDDDNDCEDDDDYYCEDDDDAKASALYAASAGGHEILTQLLLDNGANIDAQNRGYGTALKAASFGGFQNVVELLLSRGANVNAQAYGSALQAASYNGHKEVVRILLENGAEIDAIRSDQKMGPRKDALEHYLRHLHMEFERGKPQKSHIDYTRKGFRHQSEAIFARDQRLDGYYRDEIVQYGTALQIASFWGHGELVQLLFDKGANINARSEVYGTALHAAAFWDNEEMVELLLRHGADVKAECTHLGTALHVSSHRGHQRIVALLLANGASINAQNGKYLTALQAALAGGHFELAQSLINQGADINAEGGEYGSALIAALSRQNVDVTQLLLDKGADVNIRSIDHGNALVAALRSESRECAELAELLLDKGADPNVRGLLTGRPIHSASGRGYLNIVKLLLDRGVSVDSQAGDFGTALHAALQFGHLEVARFLLDNGADVNASGGRYGTALCAAADDGHRDFVEILLDKGADINASSAYCSTALVAAVGGGDFELVRLLVERGADVNAQPTGDHTSETALQVASERGCQKIVELLLDAGADVNARGGEYNTALQAASLEGYQGIVQLLLDAGADVNARGGEYGSALQAARSGRYYKLARLLVDWGADTSVLLKTTDTRRSSPSKH